MISMTIALFKIFGCPNPPQLSASWSGWTHHSAAGAFARRGRRDEGSPDWETSQVLLFGGFLTVPMSFCLGKKRQIPRWTSPP